MKTSPRKKKNEGKVSPSKAMARKPSPRRKKSERKTSPPSTNKNVDESDASACKKIVPVKVETPTLEELKDQVSKFSSDEITNFIKMIQPDAKEVKFAPGCTPPEKTPTRLRPASYSANFTPAR